MKGGFVKWHYHVCKEKESVTAAELAVLIRGSAVIFAVPSVMKIIIR